MLRPWDIRAALDREWRSFACELRPFFDLDASDETRFCLAVRMKDERFSSSHAGGRLPERTRQIGCMRDDDSVLSFAGRLGGLPAQPRGARVVRVRLHALSAIIQFVEDSRL